LTKLQSLDLRNNRLSGPIPHTIGDLRELKFLSLDGNKFVGSIPDSIGYLDKLGTCVGEMETLFVVGMVVLLCFKR